LAIATQLEGPFVTTPLGNSVTLQAGGVEQLSSGNTLVWSFLAGTLDSYIPSAGGESPELIRAIGKHRDGEYARLDLTLSLYVPESRSSPLERFPFVIPAAESRSSSPCLA